MHEKLERSLESFIVQSSRHCRRFRLAGHDLSSIPIKELRALASSMLDHFEEEVDRLQTASSARAKDGAPSDNGSGNAPASNMIKPRSRCS